MGAEDKSYYRNQRGTWFARRQTGNRSSKKSENLWKWNEVLQIVSSPRWQEHLLCKNQHKQRLVSLTWSRSEMMDRHKSAWTKEENTPAACFLHRLQFHFLWSSPPCFSITVSASLFFKLNFNLSESEQKCNQSRKSFLLTTEQHL